MAPVRMGVCACMHRLPWRTCVECFCGLCVECVVSIAMSVAVFESLSVVSLSHCLLSPRAVLVRFLRSLILGIYG